MADGQAQIAVSSERNGDGEHALVAHLLDVEGRRSRFGIRGARSRNGFEAPLATLARELARSRRYRRPLALVGIVPQRTSAGAAAAIRPLVRAIDSVWASAECIFVLLPESDRRDGEGLLERLGRQANGLLEGAQTHIAVFPVDGLTAGALLAIANGRMPPALVDPPASLRHDRRSTNGAHPAPADAPAS